MRKKGADHFFLLFIVQKSSVCKRINLQIGSRPLFKNTLIGKEIATGGAV